MEKNRLLVIPLLTGIILMIYSWYTTYPISINSVDDLIFNHVSVFYWVSVSLLLSSMYLIAINSKSVFLKWVLSVGVVLTLFSISYFYSFLPGSDSANFRGLNENFIKTENLDASQWTHSYYQWPLFFLLSKITLSISGLELANLEFLLYAIIGILWVTAVYGYSSEFFKANAFTSVAAFFVVMIPFLNYQYVPFSLAFSFLLIVLMLETRPKNNGIIIIQIMLFMGMLFTHFYVPFFIILYYLVRAILNKSRLYLNLFFYTLVPYFVYQITLASLSFDINISTLTSSSEVSNVIGQSLTSTLIQTDIIAQMISRTVTVSFALICFVGFIFLLIKKKLGSLNKSIILTGVIYTGLGVVLYTLGSRAIPIIFIPISIGIAYLLESRYNRYLKFIVLFLLILFVFAPLHQSFASGQFQQEESYRAQNFLLDSYNSTRPSVILAGYRAVTYLQPKASTNTSFTPYFNEATNFDDILYSVELGRYVTYNDTVKVFQTKRLNEVYDNGFSYLGIRAQS